MDKIDRINHALAAGMVNQGNRSPGGIMDADTITAYVARAAAVVVAYVAVLREMRERRRQDKDDHPLR